MPFKNFAGRDGVLDVPIICRPRCPTNREPKGLRKTDS
jgi:hypothetical protein